MVGRSSDEYMGEERQGRLVYMEEERRSEKRGRRDGRERRGESLLKGDHDLSTHLHEA